MFYTSRNAALESVMKMNLYNSRIFHVLCVGILALALAAFPLKVDLKTISVELASAHAGKDGGRGGKGFGQANGKFGDAKIAKGLTLTKFYGMNFGFGTRGGHIIRLLLLVLAVWAIVNIAQSWASTGAKVLWIVFVLALPLVGFLAWLVAGPRAR